MPPFEVEILSKQEADSIWKARGRRADDFQEYVDFLNQLSIGDSFRVRIPKGTPIEKNEEEAKKLKYNFNEAAKERTRAYKLTADPATLPAEELVVPLDQWNKGDDGNWYAHGPEPVVLRWKVDSHIEKQTVKKDGKSAQIDVKVIDVMTLLVVNTEAVRKRGPRKPKTTTETPANGTATEQTSPLDDVQPSTDGQNADAPSPVEVPA